MRRTIGVAVALAALVTGAASAAPSRDELIRPGVGIAKARLGMTSTQLRKAMGRPMAVIVTPQGFGRRHLEWQYGYGSYIVRMQGPNGRERVMSVTTVLRKEKTASGVGVGVREADLLRREKGVRCEPHERDTDFAPPHVYMGGRRVCSIAAAQAQTVFVIEGPRVLLDRESVAEFEARWRREATILLVSVRASGYREPSARALASRQRDALIRPGIGISKVKLGMTAGQVRAAMGAPEGVVRTRLTFGRSRIEYQYGIGSFTVHLVGRAGRERVAGVGTWWAGERTPSGIGVGDREVVARRTYAKLRCTAYGREVMPVGTFTGQVAPYTRYGGWRWCYLGAAGGPQTVLVIQGPTALLGPGLPGTKEQFDEEWTRAAKVFAVLVRAADYKHPDETAPD